MEIRYCKHCGKDFKIGIKDFCSKECASLYFDKEIKKAIEKDDSHTQNLT